MSWRIKSLCVLQDLVEPKNYWLLWSTHDKHTQPNAFDRRSGSKALNQQGDIILFAVAFI
jgi:hypothetical protein